MSNMNFFTPYIKKDERAKTGFKRLISLGALLLSIVVLISVFNFYMIYRINSDIEDLDNLLAEPEMQKKRFEMETMKTQMAVSKEYIQELRKLDSRIEGIEVIDIELLDNITSTMPAEIIFKTLNLSINDVIITGTTSNREAVAEMEYNLNKTGLYGLVHVKNINKEKTSGGYTFSLSGNFKH